MDGERLAQIRARLESASPGPWRTYQNVNGYLLVVGRDGDSGTDSFPPIHKSNADMEFCAHARSDVPDLLAEVERLRSIIGEPPPGSHPDEWQPRGGTWHGERANWQAEVDRLRAALAEAERDKARLDWLEVHAPNGDFARFCPTTGETVRGVIDAAIDAAMNTTQDAQEQQT